MTDRSLSPLAETRLVGERKREEWLLELATRSHREKWVPRIARWEVEQSALTAIHTGHIQSDGSFANLRGEGTLATHHAVRHELPRLIALRDQLWAAAPVYLRGCLHGPYQTLVELMRRQKRPDERIHVTSVAAFLAYLHTRFDGRR